MTSYPVQLSGTASLHAYACSQGAKPALMDRRPLPPALLALVGNDDGVLAAAMDTLDMNLIYEDGMWLKPIDPDDFLGYAAQNPYAELYTVAVTGSGGAYHLWPMGAPGGGAADAWPVVYIGSEGERAKVGRSVTEFLQIACSLAPYHPDAVGRLPGINTLPDNGDIAGATADDFDTAQVAALIEGWSVGAGNEEPEITAAADAVLSALGVPRLGVRAALDILITAHLANPRFAIRSEDADDNE